MICLHCSQLMTKGGQKEYNSCISLQHSESGRRVSVNNAIYITREQDRFFLAGTPSICVEPKDSYNENVAIQDIGYYEYHWGRIHEQAAGSYLLWHISLNSDRILAEVYERNRPSKEQSLFKLLKKCYPQYIVSSPLQILGLRREWAITKGRGELDISIVATLSSEQDARQFIINELLHKLFLKQSL